MDTTTTATNTSRQHGMDALLVVLTELRMEEYHQALVGAALDTWQDVMETTEEGLKAIGIKPGCRRLLQRRVAQEYGVQKWESIPFNQDGTVGRPSKKLKRKQDEAQKFSESSIKGSPTSSLTKSRRTSKAASPRSSNTMQNSHSGTTAGAVAPPAVGISPMASMQWQTSSTDSMGGSMFGGTQASSLDTTDGGYAGFLPPFPAVATSDLAYAGAMLQLNSFNLGSPENSLSPPSQLSYTATNDSSRLGSVDTFTSYNPSDVWSGSNISSGFFSDLTNYSQGFRSDFNNGHLADAEFMSNSFFDQQYNTVFSGTPNVFFGVEQPDALDHAFDSPAPTQDMRELFPDAPLDVFAESMILAGNGMESYFEGPGMMSDLGFIDTSDPSASVLFGQDQ